MGQIVNLKQPDNSIEFFQDLKLKSEKYWETVKLDKDIYGFQTQQSTKWNKGLTAEQIDSLESEMGLKLTEGLRNYYSVMNGVNLESINIYGSSGEEQTYYSNFYSYPKDLDRIKEQCKWIYESNNVSETEITSKGISRIFPVYGHRFQLIDNPDGLILSMYGDDIIYWTDNISKLLATEIFEEGTLSSSFTASSQNIESVKFWLD